MAADATGHRHVDSRAEWFRFSVRRYVWRSARLEGVALAVWSVELCFDRVWSLSTPETLRYDDPVAQPSVSTDPREHASVAGGATLSRGQRSGPFGGIRAPATYMTLIELVAGIVTFSVGSFCFTYPDAHAFALALMLGVAVAGCYAVASMLVGLVWRRLPSQPKGREAAITRVLFIAVYCTLLFSLVPHPSLLGWPALAFLFFGLSKFRWHQFALGVFGVLLALAVVLHFYHRAPPNNLMEPSPGGALKSACAGRVVGPAWLIPGR